MCISNLLIIYDPTNKFLSFVHRSIEKGTIKDKDVEFVGWNEDLSHPDHISINNYKLGSFKGCCGLSGLYGGKPI